MRMPRSKVLVAVLGMAMALIVVGCGRSAEGGDSSSSTTVEGTSSVLNLDPMTPAAKGEADKVTWATYREVLTLDPIQAFDYPENTVVSAMCESVLRAAPDGKVGPGLTTLEYASPTELVLTLQSGAEFWDGKPVTAEDVAFSLNRNIDPSAGSFYGYGFDRVKSIVAEGSSKVKITLKQPDYALEGELSTPAGDVVEKAFVEKAGKSFGTPGTGVMCSGAYKLKSWNGETLTVEANPAYWGTEKPQTKEIEFRGIPDEAALTAALQTGEVDGDYTLGISTWNQLEKSGTVKTYQGPSYAMAYFVVTSTNGGVLEDVKVRQALSMAIDRKAYVERGFQGSAIMPRNLSNPGMWGYGKQVFEENWKSLPEPEFDVAKAKKMVEEAGAAGKTLTIGLSNEINATVTEADAVRSAAESIGLKVKYKSVPAAQFLGFFTDPKAREGVDGVGTIYYSNSADPLNIYLQVAMPGGVSNLFGFEDPKITSLLEKARGTADEDARAKVVTEAGDLINEELPWIPLAAPTQQLVLNKEFTGVPTSFVYMTSPWANGLGTAE